jgi:preprotein translocase subunit SecD
MTGTLSTRLIVVALMVVISLWSVSTSFLGASTAEKLARQEELVKAASEGRVVAEAIEELAWWEKLLPTFSLRKGLDISGGIDLTLDVQVDEALVSAVQRDLVGVREGAADEGLNLKEVLRSRGEAVMLIEGDEGVSMGEVSAFMQKRHPDYEYLEDRSVEGRNFHAFGFQKTYADILRARAVEQALQTLRNRVDATGLKEPTIVRKGDTRINVQFPGTDDIKQATEAIGTAAVLEFQMVDKEAGRKITDSVIEDARKALGTRFEDDDAVNDWLVQQGLLENGTRLMFEMEARNGIEQRSLSHEVVREEVMLTGDDINDARVSWDQDGWPVVELRFEPRGARIFCDVTSNNVGRQFAIVLDKKLRSAPVINDKICGGRGQITMSRGADQRSAEQAAKVLALVLRTGSLPAPVIITNVKTVGPSMGGDAVDAGVMASAIGSALVALFMIAYYRMSGVVAIFSLALNVLMCFAMLSAAEATLTLPGICGVALTVGMAADCNIIFYERIREELALGKNARSSVDAAFDKALWAVLDSNITTFIAGVVLYTYGTGPIRGFAVTLMIGIVTTLITGIFVSRALMDFMARKANARLSI